jgi:phosphohistidine phosphatase SixA
MVRRHADAHAAAVRVADHVTALDGEGVEEGEHEAGVVVRVPTLGRR